MCNLFNKNMLEIMHYFFYSVGVGCSLSVVYDSSVPKADIITVHTSIFVYRM